MIPSYLCATCSHDDRAHDSYGCAHWVLSSALERGYWRCTCTAFVSLSSQVRIA
jgi:hypothetical protein